MSLNESIVEDAALEWFGDLGYAVERGPQLAPGEPAAERESFGEVVLAGRLREAIRRLNPAIPEEAREEALRKVLRWGRLRSRRRTAPFTGCCATRCHRSC
jgi:type I restriction enzyme, R subunit